MKHCPNGRTNHTVKYVERRLEVEVNSKTIHLEEHLKNEQTEKDELRIIYKHRKLIQIMNSVRNTTAYNKVISNNKGFAGNIYNMMLKSK